MSILTVNDETRLRDLATGIAKDVEDIDKLLERLGFTREDYNELAETRAFKSILSQATSEWEGAGNTHKRIKLKAAINIENALPEFYHAMVDPKEPLSSKVKAFEVVARVAGLGNPEIQAGGGGQFFKLEINLGSGVKPVVLTSGIPDVDGGVLENVGYSQSMESSEPPRQGLSKVFAGVEVDDW